MNASPSTPIYKWRSINEIYKFHIIIYKWKETQPLWVLAPSSVDISWYCHYLTSSLRFSRALLSPGVLETFSGNGAVLFNWVIFALDEKQRISCFKDQVTLYPDHKKASLYKKGGGGCNGLTTKLAFPWFTFIVLQNQNKLSHAAQTYASGKWREALISCCVPCRKNPPLTSGSCR